MSDTNPRWLLKAIYEAGGELESQFGGVDDELARWRPDHDDWCLTELFGHLADAAELHRRWLTLIVRQHRPALPKVDIESWPRERRYTERPLIELIDRFAESRYRTVQLLRNLDEDDWGRWGEHPYRGRLTVLDVVEDIKESDLQHLWQARRLVRAFEGARGLPAGSLIG